MEYKIVYPFLDYFIGITLNEHFEIIQNCWWQDLFTLDNH